MRGQLLFIRALEASDGDDIRAFLAQHSNRSVEVPARGLLGKVVGDLVAVMSISITDDSIHIDDLTVATELRRKRIGRFMVREALQVAKQMDRSQVAVDDECGAEGFFQRVGFVSDGTRMVMRV
ncbi:MAG: GNAT family N-acetyltransferase [Thermoanaerobaculia bacterium]